MQRYAEMVLNLRDVEFAKYYNDPICRDAVGYVLEASFKFRWHHRYGFEQWWLDAFTVDPHKLLQDESGLWMPGLEQHVVQTDLKNAGLGTVPSVQVYIAVHSKHGTRRDSVMHMLCGVDTLVQTAALTQLLGSCALPYVMSENHMNDASALKSKLCAGCTSPTRG